MRIILASQSPRRRQLLEQLGWEFEVIVSDVEEKITKKDPGEVVEELSRRKAEAVMLSCEECKEDLLVIGADTVVSLDGCILGKPADEREAMDMLHRLQGRSHSVHTGVTMCFQSSRNQGMDREYQELTFSESTTVRFYPMTVAEIQEYLASREPYDKAGAYGIQGICARYIRGIQGDYNNVVGLPIGRLYQELRKWRNPLSEEGKA